MWNHVSKALGLTALCFGLAATSVSASETRVAAFLIPCDGSAKIVTFTATGLGNSVNRFIQGAEITLIETVAAFNISFSTRKAARTSSS